MTGVEQVTDGVVFRADDYDRFDEPVARPDGQPTDVEPIVFESGDHKELAGSSVSTKDIKAPKHEAPPDDTPAENK